MEGLDLKSWYSWSRTSAGVHMQPTFVRYNDELGCAQFMQARRLFVEGLDSAKVGVELDKRGRICTLSLFTSPRV